MAEVNHLGQPVGLPVDLALPRPAPQHLTLAGRYGAVVPLEAGHADALFAAYSEDPEGRGWTYMPLHPWPDVATARAWAMQAAESEDPLFFAVTDPDGVALGVCSYLRIAPEVGSVEVGFIHFAPPLQRTRLATEAMALMMGHVFDHLGYRRYEWKCDALNAPSRAAAGRLGFTYEGTFRQATVVKGRNRDTAWFSVIDSEWPRLKAGFEAWLAPENFDAEGRQKVSLKALREG
ncbi:GNAT family N-acetyltransferase [Allosediminivita pacifica]|uniref:RimJ/RimL family protein N-acetyltransferase n=1 Tax=Allosediminivita pacifica TaxID=1267769 RepID=A0A2T6BA46_9RHOB|nr:GNAT family protein [Allosediminivita pacifica]PTX52902.1 RimJ/RimL family protein N-acetyltransferase [Allosediminivita pacifica]GGA94732.1 acetyltransferase [Allosediminivita pacifica]